ncbi:TetR/AcrR family transcriptional regulator [Streptomyces roseirectus]|uniref:TetR/AcrR family transcriptional regulator n=1 Tax=Streptomyces roseirectus TaxID=2768066 RepID=A0A7H0IR86_9ACTN|nr:TetR family transcriptional regulator [Streptomyces roseirectus]QNP75302.1 TetR/AcrR family transcriptional regulator [Streptomyces roseirectus]
MSAAVRKEALLETALRMAREDGAGALTLARLADACGLSKPIAYQHFGTLTGLLRAMAERVGAEYEDTVRAVMAGHRETGTAPEGALRALCATYVTCTLENGALHADVCAALVAAGEPAQTVYGDDAARYCPLVAELIDADPRTAYALTVAFLGAADRLCEAVLAKRLGQDEAVTVLMRLFLLPDRS